MTKYILESGNMTKYPEKAKVFFEDALKGLGATPNILWCFFATPEEERTQRYQKYMSKASGLFPSGVTPYHVYATLNDFEKQAHDADFIQIQGGETALLKQSLKEFDLKRLFDGKVVAGHSAGSHVLSDTYWSPGSRKCGKGFGLLHVKFLSHFNSNYGLEETGEDIDWKAAKAELEAYGDTSLPVYALEEGNFVVIEK